MRSWWNFLFGSLSIVVLLVWHHFFLQPLSYTEKINGVTQFDASGQIITHAWNMFTMPGSSWVVLIAAALITGFGAFYLLTHATKRLKAGELAAISYQETIMASLLGLFMFGETMTTFQIIGGALIVCGGVAQIFFSTAAASKQGEKIEKEEEIRENPSAARPRARAGSSQLAEPTARKGTCTYEDHEQHDPHRHRGRVRGSAERRPAERGVPEERRPGLPGRARHRRAHGEPRPDDVA